MEDGRSTDISEPRRTILLSLTVGLVIIALGVAAFVNGRLNEADTCGRVGSGSPQGEYANGGLTDEALLAEARRAVEIVQPKNLAGAEAALTEVVVLLERDAPRDAVVAALAEWWQFCDTPSEREALKAQPDWRVFGRPLID